jgi:TPR repeat protein
MKHYIVIILFCFLASFQTFAGSDNEYEAEYQLSLGNGFYDSKDYAKAFNAWQIAADKGSAMAYFKLGNCYSYGEGVKEDDNKAIMYYTKAAKAGIPEAEYEMSQIYYDHENYKETMKWLLLAANQGFAEAQYDLSSAYHDGEGTEMDPAKSAEWLKKAAAQKFDETSIAQFDLGSYYEKGYGVKQDYRLAYYWYKKSADNGLAKAKEKCNNADFMKLVNLESQSSAQDQNNALTAAVPQQQQENKTTTTAPQQQDNSTVEQTEPAEPNVDSNIPVSKTVNKNTFAVIVANEKYQQEAAVPYALNDGNTFAKYCKDALGLPAKNIHCVDNATLNNIRHEVGWLKDVMAAYNGEAKVIFYYAGHGIPDEKHQTAYLLPVDGYGNDATTGYSLDDLYSALGAAPAKDVVVLLDACFSGAKRDGGMLASARGVAIKVKDAAPQGNMLVFTAAQGDETAFPYKEQSHGLFTYYLLKGLQDTKGDASLKQLVDYVTTNVRRQSIVINGKSQTPTANVSPTLSGTWQKLTLK